MNSSIPQVVSFKGRITCPYCGDTHQHGLTLGIRIAHCAPIKTADGFEQRRAPDGSPLVYQLIAADESR